MKMISISSIAFILLVKVSVSSDKGDMKLLTVQAICVIVFWTLAMHVTFLIINMLAAFVLKLPNDQKKCIVILASQKSLGKLLQ